MTALHKACELQRIGVVETLLEFERVDVNLASAQGLSLLDSAVMHNRRAPLPAGAC